MSADAKTTIQPFSQGMRSAIERADAIRWIRIRMVRHGLSLEDLRAAGCFRNEGPIVVCYRNAAGETWDGVGEMPSWLRRAVTAGQSAAFFRVDQLTDKAVRAGRPPVIHVDKRTPFW
ncbi:H-NS histone family protein (plasmid) [Cupriavidus sp. P-10]|uniref:H-NS family nucleoid-associated regulatory protein n=1 Tax=Cupriavidus sp. P-10 TaxID=2027911 RepID=UPI002187D728|nr:H-NS histone family protein [Cupriavidus sp. P-10]